MTEHDRKKGRFVNFSQLSGKEFHSMLRENKASVEAINRGTMLKASRVSAILLGVMLVMSFIMDWPELRLLYAVFSALSALFYFFFRYVVPRLGPDYSVRFASYGFAASLFIMATCIACFIEPVGTSVTMVVMAVLLPMLLLDGPLGILLMLAAACGGFILCAVYKLPPNDAENAIFNVLSFSCCGVFLGRYISEIKLLALDSQRRLAIQSLYDPLTGLGNRRNLFDTLAELEKPGGEKLTGCIMTDIDYFKMYNDSCGHQAGDDCLRRLGEVMRQNGERHGVTYYRYGGEEFLAVATSATPLDEAARSLVADVEAVGIPFASCVAGHVTVSAGYAPAEEGLSSEACIDRADRALYTAKSQGRNRAVAFSGELGEGYQCSLRQRGQT